jgi:hypothetical protein
MVKAKKSRADKAEATNNSYIFHYRAVYRRARH